MCIRDSGVRALLANGCDATAFFCADDITAIGAMKAIKEHGLRIPEDVSVASIDDIDTAQMCIRDSSRAICKFCKFYINIFIFKVTQFNC